VSGEPGEGAPRASRFDASLLDASLLDAKLSIPQARRGSVSARLIEAARSSDCRVVAVTAPAGYGKSTLLVLWAVAEDRRVAWVSLDRLDDDLAGPADLVGVRLGWGLPGWRHRRDTDQRRPPRVSDFT
jgi:hypothetical protein